MIGKKLGGQLVWKSDTPCGHYYTKGQKNNFEHR
jgi:hypothetical protein